ncbi:hypothetical protein BDW74DRAFT_146211, partial [Aspergillus multicolor]|uniref:uncharacterized protein n=1 Tax=Aspergillus multicolor TaxID=41759 RepID=UPI003CCD5F52
MTPSATAVPLAGVLYRLLSLAICKVAARTFQLICWSCPVESRDCRVRPTGVPEALVMLTNSVLYGNYEVRQTSRMSSFRVAQTRAFVSLLH